MRALIQRVTEASVTIDGQQKSAIEAGLLILLGIAADDTSGTIPPLVEKIVNLRIFENEDGKFDRSLLDVHGQALVVSQFTLYADTRKGRRPSFTDAARPETAEPLIEEFIAAMRAKGIDTQTGQFQSHMKVMLINDGPVTIFIDSNG